MANDIKFYTEEATSNFLATKLNSLTSHGYGIHSIHRMSNDIFAIVYTRTLKKFKADEAWLAKVKAEQANGE